MPLPLEGIKILDLSRTLPGLFCTQLLADFGAEIIKIENKGGNQGRWVNPLVGESSARFYAVNRNKKSITLDLKREEGKSAFKRLVASSDVVVDGFRPGVMEKLGLDYNALKNINQGIVYCALNGFGSTGPLRSFAAHDINILSMAGVTGLTGTSDGNPGMSPVQLAGTAGGSLYAVIAILIALIYRQQTGQGQFCDVSMLDGTISLLAFTLAEWSGWGRLPQRGKELITGGYAFSQIYETSDSRYVSVGAAEPKFWEEFCLRIGLPEYITTQRRPEMQAQMIENINTRIKQKSQAEWMDIFNDANICFTPVLEVDEMCEHPQVVARDMIIKLSNFKGSGKDMVWAGLPVKLSASPGQVKLTFPKPGEHTTEVLTSAGYTAKEIELLKITGVI